jgi:hypothetical protein
MVLNDPGLSGGSSKRQLTAEHVAARVLLDANSIEDAATRILQAICESLGCGSWSLSHGVLNLSSIST